MSVCYHCLNFTNLKVFIGFKGFSAKLKILKDFNPNEGLKGF